MRIKLPQSKFYRFLVYAAGFWAVAGIFLAIFFRREILLFAFFAAWNMEQPAPSAQSFGVPLPPTATDVRVAKKASIFGGDYYLSAVISHDEYAQVVAQLGLRHRTDLLQYWPGALDAQETPWWTLSSVNDDDTYFGDSEPSAYIVTRYEGGRIYFKREVY